MFGLKNERGRREILIRNIFGSQGDERYFKTKLHFYPCNFIIRMVIFTIYNSNKISLKKYNDIYH